MDQERGRKRRNSYDRTSSRTSPWLGKERRTWEYDSPKENDLERRASKRGIRAAPLVVVHLRSVHFNEDASVEIPRVVSSEDVHHSWYSHEDYKAFKKTMIVEAKMLLASCRFRKVNGQEKMMISSQRHHEERGGTLALYREQLERALHESYSAGGEFADGNEDHEADLLHLFSDVPSSPSSGGCLAFLGLHQTISRSATEFRRQQRSYIYRLTALHQNQQQQQQLEKSSSDPDTAAAFHLARACANQSRPSRAYARYLAESWYQCRFGDDDDDDDDDVE